MKHLGRKGFFNLPVLYGCTCSAVLEHVVYAVNGFYAVVPAGRKSSLQGFEIASAFHLRIFSTVQSQDRAMHFIQQRQEPTPIERIQMGFLVPLVSHILRNGTKTAAPHTKGTAVQGVIVVDSRLFCEVSAGFVGILVLYQIGVGQHLDVAFDRGLTLANLLSYSGFLDARVGLDEMKYLQGDAFYRAIYRAILVSALSGKVGFQRLLEADGQTDEVRDSFKFRRGKACYLALRHNI